jgi:hypothetical protein
VATVICRGSSNPIIVVPPEEVLAWLRKIADDLGYADHQTCAVQVVVANEFQGGARHHLECPTLALMVSNIPNGE